MMSSFKNTYDSKTRPYVTPSSDFYKRSNIKIPHDAANFSNKKEKTTQNTMSPMMGDMMEMMRCSMQRSIMDQEAERAERALEQARYEEERVEHERQQERSKLAQQQQAQQQNQFMMMMMAMMSQMGCGMGGNFGGATFRENSGGEHCKYVLSPHCKDKYSISKQVIQVTKDTKKD